MAETYEDEKVENRRETVPFWENQIRGWRGHAQHVLDATLRYSAWLSGNLADVEGDVRRITRCKNT